MTNQIKYEFASGLYGCESYMLRAIAETWVTADGANSDEFVAEYLAENTPAEIARECIYGYGLDQDGDCAQSHMEFNGYGVDDLARAFADLKSEYCPA